MGQLRVRDATQAAAGMQGDLVAGLGPGLHLDGLEAGNRPARGVGGKHDLEGARLGDGPVWQRGAQDVGSALRQEPDLRRPGLPVMRNGCRTVLQHLPRTKKQANKSEQLQFLQTSVR